MIPDIARSYKTGLTKFGFSRRRGLTTVVTAALMLTAVTILGSAMVVWSNGNLKVFETALSTTAVNSTNKITENVNIENIAFCTNCVHSNSQNVTNVTLTNTGTIGVTINQIKVNGTVINKYVMGTTLPTNILPQKSYLVSAGLPTKWHSKSVDTITVITARSSIFTTQVSPP